MKKIRIPKKSAGQLELFPEAIKATPQQFADQLHHSKIIAAKIRCKRPKQGAGKSIDVKKEIATAYSALHKMQGINAKSLMQELANAKTLDTASIMKNRQVIEPINRSPQEMRQIKKALETIVYFAKRNRKRKELAKIHAKSIPEIIQANAQKKHLNSITRE
jgi:hypothetical protein